MTANAGLDLPRIAVLASGRGSNLQAIIDAIAEGRLQARLVGVFSDRPGAAALERVPEDLRWSANARSFPFREAFDAEMGDAVERVSPDWIMCAGYMRILGADFVQRFRGRLLNIHPSLLPKYKGLHTHERAIAAGDREHGASVHFVVPELDAGAVIAQVSIAITPEDTPDMLAARLLPHEHRLMIDTLALCTAGRVAEQDERVVLDGQPLFTPLKLDCAAFTH